MVEIDADVCTGCGGCIDLCPSVVINLIENRAVIDPDLCAECKLCVRICPVNAPHEQ